MPTETLNKLRNKDSMHHMVKYYMEIRFFVQNHNENSFGKDKRTIRAVTTDLIQIGEYSNKITPYYKDRHDQVRWDALRTTRNRLAHEYGSVSPKRIWYIVNHELPSNIEAIIELESNIKVPEEYERSYKNTSYSVRCEKLGPKYEQTKYVDSTRGQRQQPTSQQTQIRP